MFQSAITLFLSSKKTVVPTDPISADGGQASPVMPLNMAFSLAIWGRQVGAARYLLKHLET